MSDIYLDPYVLACPLPGSSETEYRAYIATLTELQNTWSHGCIRMFVPSKTMSLLESEGRLPPWEKGEMDVYVQREEVSRLLFGLLAKLKSVEDHVQIADILIDQSNAEPSSHLRDRSPAFVDSYHWLLAFVCLTIDLQRSTHGTMVLTKGLAVAVAVHASGQVIIAEFVNKTTAITLPYKYEKSIMNVPSMRVGCTIIDPIVVWRSGFIRKAIDLTIFRLGEESDEIWPNVEYRYRIHPDFEATTGLLDTDARISMALRACAETITATNMRDTHAIRTSTGANSSQVKRAKDNASAWRRDIDREFHLHYWTMQGEVELAVIVPHNDLDIPE